MKNKRSKTIIPILIMILIVAIIIGNIVLSQPRPILKEGSKISTYFVLYNGNMMENVDDGKISEVLSKYKCKFASYRSTGGYQMDDYPINFCTDHFDAEKNQYISEESMHIRIGKSATVCFRDKGHWVYNIIDADELQAELEEILGKATPREEDHTSATPSDIS